MTVLVEYACSEVQGRMSRARRRVDMESRGAMGKVTGLIADALRRARRTDHAVWSAERECVQETITNQSRSAA